MGAGGAWDEVEFSSLFNDERVLFHYDEKREERLSLIMSIDEKEITILERKAGSIRHHVLLRCN